MLTKDGYPDAPYNASSKRSPSGASLRGANIWRGAPLAAPAPNKRRSYSFHHFSRSFSKNKDPGPQQNAGWTVAPTPLISCEFPEDHFLFRRF